jgi:hypothetical protein
MKDIRRSHPLLAVAVCGCSLVVVDVHQLIVDRTDEPRLKERDILGSCTRHMTGRVDDSKDMPDRSGCCSRGDPVNSGGLMRSLFKSATGRVMEFLSKVSRELS